MASSKRTQQNLYETASRQGGFFTTRQAVLAGYSDAVHAYHLRNGDWERVQRRIYRLRRYPQSDMAQLIIWSLWSTDRAGRVRGIYSHRTALEVHKLVQPQGGRFHMTVDPSFRRMNPLPDHIEFYRHRLDSEEMVMKEGVLVTSLDRTIEDLNKSGELKSLLPDYEIVRPRKPVPAGKPIRTPAPKIQIADPVEEPVTPVKETEATSWAVWD